MLFDQVRVETSSGPLEWSFAPPSGYTVMKRAVPHLGYPWEVAAIADWEFPQNTPRSRVEEDVHGGWPRLDLMPPNRLFIWLVMGDTKKDNQVEPRTGGFAFSHQELALTTAPTVPVGGVPRPTGITRLTERDRSGGRWPTVSTYERIVFLMNRLGMPESEPLYLFVRVFAGLGRHDISATDSVLASLRYRYVS